jgi:hypothetical protein
LIKRIIVLLAVTAISVLALAVPAFAQGQVERGPEHANSICSYSGLNDNNPDEQGADLGRVQSYGDYVQEGVEEPSERNPDTGYPSPGTLCNGHLFPYPEAFPEDPEE